MIKINRLITSPVSFVIASELVLGAIELDRFREIITHACSAQQMNWLEVREQNKKESEDSLMKA